MWHARGRGEVFTGFRLRGPEERDHWEDLGTGERITLRWNLGNFGIGHDEILCSTGGMSETSDWG